MESYTPLWAADGRYDSDLMISGVSLSNRTAWLEVSEETWPNWGT